MDKGRRAYIISLAMACICMAVFIILLGELIVGRDSEHEAALMQDAALNTGALIAQDIQRNISAGLFVTETLNSLLRANGYSPNGFNDWGRQIVASGSRASVVELAPDGVVSYIYPLKGNEGAIGHDLLKDKRRAAGALKAVSSKELTFIGPIKLIQNGKYAVIARKPVFWEKDGKEAFWGFTIALLFVEDILPSQLAHYESQGFSFQLVGDNPDGLETSVLYASKGWDGTSAICMRITVPNGEWTLKLSPSPVENNYYAAFRAFVIFLSILIPGYIFVQQSRMRSKQQEVICLNEQLIELSFKDELTEIGNRRAGMQLLENLVNQAGRYEQDLAIAMIDLDYFKDINDKYGHPAGDYLLRHVTCCFADSIRKSDAVFRLGGDEFLMIFPQTTVADALNAVHNMVEHVEGSSCVYESIPLQVSFSIGVAGYERGELMESLFRRADMKLYEAKAAGRNKIRS